MAVMVLPRSARMMMFGEPPPFIFHHVRLWLGELR
jgi:hypothetical protein